MSDGLVGGRPGQGRGVSNSIEAQIRQLEARIAQQARENESLRNGLADAQERLAEGLRQLRQPDAAARPRTIADIPGPRNWRQYTLRIPFAQGETGMQQATVEISTDGPFILTDTTVHYLIDDSTNAPAILQKRVVPCTGFFSAVYQAGQVTDTTMAGAVQQYLPELFFQIRIDGSGRYWTNLPVPAAAFMSWTAPKYAGIESWVDSKNRLILEATPQLAMPLAGVCVATFSGYQINGSISIAEILGYAP